MSENGAFVDLDNTRLSRDGLVMLGMKEALDNWITKLMTLARDQPHKGVGKVMAEIAEEMTKDRDGIAVELTRSALRNKSGVLQHIRKD